MFHSAWLRPLFICLALSFLAWEPAPAHQRACSYFFVGLDRKVDESEKQAIAARGDRERKQILAFEFITNDLLPSAPDDFFYYLGAILPVYAALAPPNLDDASPLQRELASSPGWRRTGWSQLTSLLERNHPIWANHYLKFASPAIKEWLIHASLSLPPLRLAREPHKSRKSLMRPFGFLKPKRPGEQVIRDSILQMASHMNMTLETLQLVLKHSSAARQSYSRYLARYDWDLLHNKKVSAEDLERVLEYHISLFLDQKPRLPHADLDTALAVYPHNLQHYIRFHLESRQFVEFLVPGLFLEMSRHLTDHLLATEKGISATQKLEFTLEAIRRHLQSDELNGPAGFPFLFLCLMAGVLHGTWPHPEEVIHALVENLHAQYATLKEAS